MASSLIVSSHIQYLARRIRRHMSITNIHYTWVLSSPKLPPTEYRIHLNESQPRPFSSSRTTDSHHGTAALLDGNKREEGDNQTKAFAKNSESENTWSVSNPLKGIGASIFDKYATMQERIKKRNIKRLMRLAWADYKYTWEGFFDNLSRDKEKQRQKEEQKDEDDENKLLKENDPKDDELLTLKLIQDKQKELRSNVGRNVNVIKKEGATVLEMVKETTGIKNKRDLKIWAMEQLKLANECVAEFMKGYRKGRDDEMDKMMNEYFKDIDFDFQEQQEEKGQKEASGEHKSGKNKGDDESDVEGNVKRIGRIRRRRIIQRMSKESQ